MKKLLILFALFPVFAQAQYIDIGMGYGTKHILAFDVGMIDKKNTAYYIEFGFQAPNGAVGEYYETVNWDELSGDHESEGKYYNIIVNASVGHKFNSFLVAGLIGYADIIKYRNCFDSYYILGKNGYYYKTVDFKPDKINIGIKTKYFIQTKPESPFYVSVGLKITTIEGLAFNLGIAF